MNPAKIEELVTQLNEAQVALADEVNRQFPVGTTVRFTYAESSHVGIVAVGAHRRSPQAISVKLPGGRWLSFGVLGVNLEIVAATPRPLFREAQS